MKTFRYAPFKSSGTIAIAFLAIICTSNMAYSAAIAATAEEQADLVRSNGRFTDVPSVGKISVMRGAAAASALPYKSLSWTYQGHTDSQCRIDGKCSSWDWANHTRPNEVTDSELRRPAASPIPSFVKNMTYMPTFACYDGDWLEWYSETLTTFEDPVPAGHIVVMASFTMVGTFVCNAPSTDFNILLTSDPISLTPLSVDTNTFPEDCSCPYCGQNLTVTTGSYPIVGLPSYFYGGQNRVSVFPMNGSLCLNALELRLYFQPKLPAVTSMFPTAGPMEGGTTLIINVEYYDPSLDYQCVLPQAIINAVKLGDGRISCLTPTPCATREAVFSMSFRIVQTQATIGALFFLPYIQPSVKTITPGRAKPGENITVTGSGFESHPDLVWYCRVGGIPSPIAVFDAAKSALICQVPISGLTLNAAAAVDVSLNGQNWSNSSVVFIAVETPVKHWYDMPTILYIVLGIVGGLILAAILIFLVVRACRRSKLSSNKLSGTDEAVEPLLRGSYGPRTPASTAFDSTSLPAEFEKLDVKQIKLGQRIGKGSFGEVYLGTYLGTEVAVKKLPANKLSTQFMQEFAREAALMRGLRHPNVVQFLGATMDEPDICIVTEYMAKGSLYHLLHDPKVAISWEMVRKIALDAAKGMAYLHMRSPAIIHRDLKSHNLLVDENWKVKVCDFGLSKIAVDQQNTMTACGTPCWTAPEILRNARYTTKADVFSYGIVLWELVTRDEPFAGMPAFQVIFAVGNKGARLPLPQVCPPELIKLIVSCWQEDPSLRPPFSDIIIYLERLSFATND